jgi:nicotinamide riboside kinase
LIGLVGAHRTGKTTLARAYADKFNKSLCITSASGVFKKLGLDPQADYDFDTRMTIQEGILQSVAERYADMPHVFITDRTPIDLMAYTLADITREGMNKERERRLEAYMNECVRITNKFFNVLIVVQPGIPLIEDATKAPASYGYIEHIATLIMGFVIKENIKAIHSYIPESTLDLDKRVKCVEYSVNRAFKILEEAHYPKDGGFVLQLIH